MTKLIPHHCRHCGAKFYFADEYRQHQDVEVSCFWCGGHTCPDSQLCHICQHHEEAIEAVATNQ